ncbi:MAG: hypothetical protein P3W89_005955, partial [Aquificaceae bacterium]|nr:hypothetical protein [Aquificaceae bacterium]
MEVQDKKEEPVEQTTEAHVEERKDKRINELVEKDDKLHRTERTITQRKLTQLTDAESVYAT